MENPNDLNENNSESLLRNKKQTKQKPNQSTNKQKQPSHCMKHDSKRPDMESNQKEMFVLLTKSLLVVVMDSDLLQQQ